MLRDQTTSFVKKPEKVKELQSTADISDSTSEVNGSCSTSTSAKSLSPVLASRSPAAWPPKISPADLYQPMEDTVVPLFFNSYLYLPKDAHIRNGFMELLPELFSNVSAGSYLHTSTLAVAFFTVAAWTGQGSLLHASQRYFTQALPKIRAALRSNNDNEYDSILMSILMMSTYEVCPTSTLYRKYMLTGLDEGIRCHQRLGSSHEGPFTRCNCTYKQSSQSAGSIHIFNPASSCANSNCMCLSIISLLFSNLTLADKNIPWSRNTHGPYPQNLATLTIRQPSITTSLPLIRRLTNSGSTPIMGKTKIREAKRRPNIIHPQQSHTNRHQPSLMDILGPNTLEARTSQHNPPIRSKCRSLPEPLRLLFRHVDRINLEHIPRLSNPSPKHHDELSSSTPITGFRPQQEKSSPGDYPKTR